MRSKTKVLWTSPTISEIGTVTELTRQGKITGVVDGVILNGQNVGISPS